jgi:uncharacterized protein (UPF0276 family)
MWSSGWQVSSQSSFLKKYVPSNPSSHVTIHNKAPNLLDLKESPFRKMKIAKVHFAIRETQQKTNTSKNFRLNNF